MRVGSPITSNHRSIGNRLVTMVEPRTGRFASAPWAFGLASSLFLLSQLRRTKDGRPISPASGRQGRLGFTGPGDRLPHPELLGWHLSKAGKATTASAALIRRLPGARLPRHLD